MKKWFIWGGPVIGIFLIFMASASAATTEETYDFYGTDWGIGMSIPLSGLEVLGSRPIPEENLVRFSIHFFDDSDVLIKKAGWKNISEENVDDIRQKLHDFQVQSVPYIHYISEEELKNAFDEFSAAPEVGDLFFYREHKKGGHFFALYKVDEHEIHTYQLQPR